MAASQLHKVTDQPPLPETADIPDEREYSDADNAEVDRALCSAIDAADSAGNEYLATLLGFELASHYYETR